jgi:hypothetical protein
MKLLTLAALAALLTFGTAMAQEVEKKMEIKVVVSDDGSDEATEVHWASDDSDFDVDDLAVGESHTIESESGRTVTITRAEEGLSFDVDGKTVMVPDMGGHGTHMAFVGDDTMQEDIDVQVTGNAHVMQAHHPEGVTIISGTPLDESVRESIRSVLISAGNNEEVTFIDGSEDGKHVVMKKIQIRE